MLPLIGTLLEAGLKIIDKVIPDPQAKAAAQLEMMKLNQAGEFKQLESDLQIALAQANINAEEAKSPDFFKSGWRPGAGWVCVLGLFYTFLAQPLLAWASTVWGWPTPPILDTNVLMTLLTGMLGLGAYRTVEKVKDKA